MIKYLLFNFKLYCLINDLKFIFISDTMNNFKIKYKGNLRTEIIHLDSGSVIITDAPKDNHGLGKTFHQLICCVLL